jgi:FkbM family methyltransferase
MNNLLIRAKESFGFRLNGLIEKLAYKKLALGWKLETGISIQIDNHAEWVIYNDIFVEGEYDNAIEASILNLEQSISGRTEFVFVDIGANVGYFTLRAIDIFRRSKLQDFGINAVLVEGSPAVYQALKTRIESQYLEEKIANIEIVNGLAGELEGDGIISETSFHVMNSVLLNDSKKNGKLVPYVNLNLLCSKYSNIDLIKCDIEGSEEKLIQNYGNILSKAKFLIFEFHPLLCDIQRCFQMLSEIGFKKFTIVRKTDAFEVVFFERRDNINAY